MIEFFFATENLHKIEEAKATLAQHNIQVKKLEGFEKIEIQHTNLEQITNAALTLIARKYQDNVIVEDSGLFIHALNGFPGPYSSHAYETIGIAGILKLLEGAKTRKAEFRSAVSLGCNGEVLATFSSVTEGTMTTQPRGQNGFGFDPIFTPIWTQKTFAEMEMKEKCIYSHRAKALSKVALWYLNDLKQRSPRKTKD